MFELDNAVEVNYGEITKMVTESAKGFSEHHIRPNVMEWDESQFFPLGYSKKQETSVLWGF